MGNCRALTDVLLRSKRQMTWPDWANCVIDLDVKYCRIKQIVRHYCWSSCSFSLWLDVFLVYGFVLAAFTCIDQARQSHFYDFSVKVLMCT